jgi:hypothetical protein
LQPTPDYGRRKAFCEWLLHRDVATSSILSLELLMDEACFILSCVGVV